MSDDRDIMEMTDIAEKMRYRSQWMGTDAIVSTLLSNGADEIDSLRALVARQRAWIDGVMAKSPHAWLFEDGTWHRSPLSELESLTMSQMPLITRPAPYEDK